MAQYGSPNNGNNYRRPAGPGPVPTMKIVLLFRKDFMKQPFVPEVKVQSIIDLFAAFDPTGASLKRSTHSHWNAKKHCTMWETKLTAAHLGCFTVREEVREAAKTGAYLMLYDRLSSLAYLLRTLEEIYTAAGSSPANLSSYLTYEIYRNDFAQCSFGRSVFSSTVADPVHPIDGRFMMNEPKRVTMTVIYFPRFEAVGENYEDAYVKTFELMMRGVLSVKEEAQLDMERCESNRILEIVLAKLAIKDGAGQEEEEPKKEMTGPE